MRQFAGLALLASCTNTGDKTPPTPPKPPDRPLEYALFKMGDTLVFRSTDGAAARFDPSTQTLEVAGKTHRPTMAWPNWKLFKDCLGSPILPALSMDPESRLTLTWSKQKTWNLHLSGLNDCGLSGTIRLGVFDGNVDVADLLSSGLAWSKGGRQAYIQLLANQLRTNVGPRFREATPDQRILLLKRLSEDPQGGQALEKLGALFPSEAKDINQAHRRWRSRFPAE